MGQVVFFSLINLPRYRKGLVVDVQPAGIRSKLICESEIVGRYDRTRASIVLELVLVIL